MIQNKTHKIFWLFSLNTRATCFKNPTSKRHVLLVFNWKIVRFLQRHRLRMVFFAHIREHKAHVKLQPVKNNLRLLLAYCSLPSEIYWEIGEIECGFRPKSVKFPAAAYNDGSWGSATGAKKKAYASSLSALGLPEKEKKTALMGAGGKLHGAKSTDNIMSRAPRAPLRCTSKRE